MDSIGPSGGIIIFFALVLLDFIFYGFSAALQHINMKEVEERLEMNKDKKSIRVHRLCEDPAKYIDTLQVVTTFIALFFGVFYIGMINNLLNISVKPLALVASFLIMMYIQLVFGVLIPKILGRRYPVKWAYGMVNLAHYIIVLLTPVTWIVSVSAKFILMIFGIRPNQNLNDVTEEEIISMVNEGQEQGVLQESEAKMIHNIFEYCDKEAMDIMTNRQNIIALSAGITLQDAIHFMLDENNSRYPVYQENIDHIIGIIHLKDAVRKSKIAGNDDKLIEDVDGLIRKVDFVPETKNVDDLFREMQQNKSQMVIVVDEYGQTSGLIALEDILEEIVGNIQDEYDEEEEYIEETGLDEYILDGMTPLDELEEKLDIDFKEEEFETLNGYLISKMDKIPDDDENFDIDVDCYNFKIIKVENHMIREVLVTKKQVVTDDMNEINN